MAQSRVQHGSVRVQRGSVKDAAWLSQGCSMAQLGCSVAQSRVQHGSVRVQRGSVRMQHSPV